MSKPISDLTLLLRSMEPVLHDGVYVYSSLPPDADISKLAYLAVVRESEDITVVLQETEAIRAGLPVLFRAAWITLTVYSDLHAVGFTAACASALGAVGISCNVVAGARHDHLFVPYDRAEYAMRVLKDLQCATIDPAIS